VIGYDQAAAVAKEAHQSGRTVREVVRDQQLVSEEELEELMDPMHMTEPGVPGH